MTIVVPTLFTTTRARDRVVLAACLMLLAVGLVGLADTTGWNDVGRQIARLGWIEIAVLLGLSLINYLFRGLRWHLFARRLDLPLGMAANLRHFIGGFAMTVTPGRVGELVRMRWIRRETGWRVDRTAPLVLIDRASDLAAMGLILGVSLMLSSRGIVGAVPVAVLSLGLAVSVTRPGLLAGLTGTGYRMLGRFPRHFARARMAARSLARFSTPSTLIGGTSLGLIGWMAEGIAFYCLLVWLGADIGLWTAMAIFVFATLAGGLTGAPGGVGGTEAAMIALLGAVDVPLEISVPATAIIRATTLWFALLLGLAIFPYAEARSRKGPHALENG